MESKITCGLATAIGACILVGHFGGVIGAVIGFCFGFVVGYLSQCNRPYLKNLWK